MEKILKENPNRFVIFPIQYSDIWEYYKMHQAAFWTAEEIDLSNDIRDWENLSDNERFFVKRVNNSIIIETNRDEFYNLPTDLYLKVQIKWVISGKDKSNISKQNLMSAKFIEKYFSTKTTLLKDSLQFFKN